MPQIPPEVDVLRKRYWAAQQKVIARIEKSKAVGNSTVYLNNVLKGMQLELDALDTFCTTWAKNATSKTFEAVMKESYALAHEKFPGMTYGNREALQILTENLTGNLLTANHAAGRASKDLVQKISAQTLLDSSAAGETLQETKRALLNAFREAGIPSVKDKNGRVMNLSSYSEMVARTTWTEVNNIATTEAMTNLGNDLVQMTEHHAACPLCAPLEGRVYSISGKTEDYPKLTVAFTGGFANIHPNCQHTLTPYFAKYDPNVEETKKKSNRPFNEPQNKEEADAYKAKQAAKAKLRQNRKEFEDLKDLPGAPKTLSGYTNMKNANSERYQALKRQSKSVDGLIKRTKTSMADASPDNSLGKYIGKDGNLVPEREALHRKILKGKLGGIVPETTQPEFVMLGGGPATGKSYTKKKYMTVKDGITDINPDDFKAALPEYTKGLIDGDSAVASFVHEESSALNKRAMDILLNNNSSFLLDGVGDGSVNSVMKKVTKAKEAGFKVVGKYVTCPVEQAQRWEAARAARTGRKVSEDILTNAHRGVSQILPQVAKDFDDVELWSTDERFPTQIIARGGSGSGLVPLDNDVARQLFYEFLQKAL